MELNSEEAKAIEAVLIDMARSYQGERDGGVATSEQTWNWMCRLPSKERDQVRTYMFDVVQEEKTLYVGSGNFNWRMFAAVLAYKDTEPNSIERLKLILKSLQHRNSKQWVEALTEMLNHATQLKRLHSEHIE